MPFFSHYPKVAYTLIDENGVERSKITTDILTTVVFQRVAGNLNAPYVHYNVQDGERPDTIATKYYGSSNYTWVVLLANEIFHANDWPKSEREFYIYLTKVYGSPSLAQSTIYGYKNADGHYIDETTYNSLSSLERTAVSYYDHEVETNEAKRQIKLINKTFLPTVINQFNIRMGQR